MTTLREKVEGLPYPRPVGGAGNMDHTDPYQIWTMAVDVFRLDILALIPQGSVLVTEEGLRQLEPPAEAPDPGYAASPDYYGGDDSGWMDGTAAILARLRESDD